MKLDERRLTDPRALANARVVLLHGDDPVLVADQGRVLAQRLGGLQEAFGTAELMGSEHVRVFAELSSPMLGASTRLVRLREATDAAAASVERVLEAPGLGVLLIEAGALPARSKLRGLAEAHREAASVQCRAADPREVAAALDRIFHEFEVVIEPAAREWLLLQTGTTGSAGGTGSATHILHDAAKLALFAGPGETIRLADVLEVGEDVTAGPLDDLAYAMTAGAGDATDRQIERLLDGGTAPVAIVRGLLNHMARLRVACEGIDRGLDPAAAVSGLRPPVFFRRSADMRAAAAAWRTESASEACGVLWHADRHCRETGAPIEAICRGVVAQIACMVGRGSRRRRSAG